MPNILNAQGITTASLQELIDNYTSSYQAIYGADINLNSNSPDGQMMGIFLQSVLDIQDLLTQIYNSFDPDLAVGVTLDQRCAINGVIRQAGTYTQTNITLTTDGTSFNLNGLDNAFPSLPLYVVQDGSGNRFNLMTSISTSALTSYTSLFQADQIGQVFTSPNTIQIPATIALGVTAVNNPTTFSVLGLNQETDAQLKIRRQQSVSISSQGYLAGLIAALKNVSGVTSATVYENLTGSTDSDGIPGHSIWCIVNGGLAADIARAIYNKRNAGCGMKGAQTYNITQLDGSSFLIKWDVVASQNLFTKFNVSSLNGLDQIDLTNIITKLSTALVPGVYGRVDINELSTLVQAIDPNALVTSSGFSTSSGGSYTTSLLPTAKNNQLAVASIRIIIYPIYISPNTALPNVAETYAMAASAVKTFVATGGFQSTPGLYAWTKTSGNGSIVGATGVFTAGAAGTTVLRVTDSLSNFTEITVTVT